MQKELDLLRQQALKEIELLANLNSAESFEIDYLGRKDGKLNNILKSLKDLSVEDKRNFGQLANEIKIEILEKLESRRAELRQKSMTDQLQKEKMDMTVPGKKQPRGSLNPNSLVQYELEDLFRSFGFIVADGPELESDYFNFEALNIPATHPARDTQDTFYIKKDQGEKTVLRTHTSPVQIRTMLKYGAPLRAIVPGKVFRNEALDASHENTFFQLEGIMVDRDLSIANLIAVMKSLLRGILKKEVKVRLRPGFFPFVEPGFELDISCLICGGRGCSVCKQSGWVELLPCGMIHPHVLRAGGIDPDEYTGFAFGLGLTRLVMMRYGIDDARLMNSGDLRFLQQF